MYDQIYSPIDYEEVKWYATLRNYLIIRIVVYYMKIIMWKEHLIIFFIKIVLAFQILREYYDSTRWEWSVHI